MTGNIKCPEPEKLTMLYFEGADEQLAGHIYSCAKCRREWDRIKALDEAGQNIPFNPPSDARIENVRTGLYASMANQRVSAKRFLPLAAVAGLAIAILTLWMIAGFTGGDIHRASIVTQSEYASYRFVSAQPDEILVLENGTVQLSVDQLKNGERFRVEVGDSFVEVRGTVFDVTARQSELLDVNVTSGKVEVVAPEVPKIVLVPGKSWSETRAIKLTEMPDLEPEPEHVEVAVLDTKAIASYATKPPLPSTEKLKKEMRVDKPTTPTLVKPSPHKIGSDLQKTMDEALNLLKTGQYIAAATRFSKAQNESGSGALKEEAGYWKAVSLHRAGHAHAAEKALYKFLAEYPGSPRSGEASVMLGWMLYNQGQTGKARTLFLSASRDPSPRVCRSATKGLEAIDRAKDEQ